jgi:hypothetical protein
VRALAIVVLLTGCSNDLLLEPPPQLADAQESALLAWETRYGPADACWADRGEIAWWVLAAEDVRARCGSPEEQAAPACHIVYESGRQEIVLTVQNDDPAQFERDVAHELVHWLLHCSGRRPDPQHVDGEVWPAMERAALAQMRGSGVGSGL